MAHRPHLQDRTRGSGSGRPVPGRRTLTGVLALVVGVALVGAVTVTLSVGSSRPAAAGSPPACPVGQSDGQGGCSVSLPCLAAYVGCDPAHPPTVDVTQVADVQDGQYVTVRTTNFPTSFTDGTTTGSMRVALCSTTSDPTDPLCLNGQWEASAQAYTPVYEQVSTLAADHGTQVAVPVFYRSSDETPSIPAQPVDSTQSSSNPGIFCDNGPDPCALEVTVVENTLPRIPSTPDTTTNTVVVPLSYVGPVTGCPASDTVLHSESSISASLFLSAAVVSSCGGSNGVIDFNTPTDTTTVATDFVAGQTDLGFVDDPADPAQESQELGGKQFAFIPVAASATTVGFLASQAFGNELLPLSTYRLTPTMLAGLMTSQYASIPTGGYSTTALSKKGIFYSDNLLAALATATTNKVPSPLGCDQLVVCQPPPGKKPGRSQLLADAEKVDAFDLLNPTPTGVTAPSQLASYMTDAPSGAAYQATSWICQQPNAPMTLDIQEVGTTGTTPVTVTDTTSGPAELTGYPYGSLIWNGDTSVPWIYPTCSPYSSLPPMTTIQGSSNPPFAQYQLPAAQANQIRNYVYGGGSVPQQGGTPYAAFGIMDSSQSAFLGMNQASVQNDAGNFVSPTATTVGDALASATPCPSGSLSCPLGTYRFDYAGSYAADAYPMPDITYAMVPTSPLPAAQAQAVKSLLTSLVNYGHGTGSAPLGSGYYPLPDTMYKAALASIASDVTSQPTPATTTTTTTTTASGPSTSGSSGETSVTSASPTAGAGGSTPYVQSAVAASTPAGLPFSPVSGSAPSAAPAAAATGSGAGPGSTEPPATLLVSLVGASRFLLPAAVLLALACLVAGTMLLFGPETRRRRRGTGHP